MSDIKKIVSKSIKTGALIIFTKIFGLASQIFLASKLGISAISDAYFLVLILPTFICNVMGSALGLSTIGLIKDQAAGIPILVKSFTILAIPLAIGTLFCTQIARYVFSIPTATEKILAFEKLAVFFWPLTSIMCLSQIICIWLNSRGHSILTSTTPLINSCTLIFFLFSFENEKILDILIYSQISGVIIEFSLLFFLSKNYGIFTIKKDFYKNLAKTNILTRSVIFTSIGWALLSLSAPIEQFFAAGSSSGTNTTIGLTNRLIVPVCAALSSLTSAILLQKLTSLSDQEDSIKYWRYYIKACILLAIFSFLVSLLGFTTSNQIIELAYGKGNFSDLDKKNIISFFNILIFLIPAQIIIALSFRAYAISEKLNLQISLIFLSILVQIILSKTLNSDEAGINIITSTLISNYILALTYILFGTWHAKFKKIN